MGSAYLHMYASAHLSAHAILVWPSSFTNFHLSSLRSASSCISCNTFALVGSRWPTRVLEERRFTPNFEAHEGLP